MNKQTQPLWHNLGCFAGGSWDVASSCKVGCGEAGEETGDCGWEGEDSASEIGISVTDNGDSG